MATIIESDVKEAKIVKIEGEMACHVEAPKLETMIYGRMKGTVQSYRNSLKVFGEFAYGATDPDVVIRSLVAGGKGRAYDDLTAFARHQRDLGRTAGTIRTQIAYIKAVTAQLFKADLIDWHPDYDRQVLHGIAVKRPTKGPSITDAVKLIVAARDQADRRFALRDEAALWLAIGCGMRASEIVSLSIADIDMKHKLVAITGKGSGGIKSWHPLSDEAAEALSRWLVLLAKAPPDNPIFMRLDGAKPSGPMTTQALRYIVKKHAKTAQIQHVWPHALRHTAITAVAHQTRDTLKTMGFARHSSLRMTQIYIDDISNEEEQRNISSTHGASIQKLVNEAFAQKAAEPIFDPADQAQ